MVSLPNVPPAGRRPDERNIALARDPPDDVGRVGGVQIVMHPRTARERPLDHGVVAGDRVAAEVTEDRVVAVQTAVTADLDACVGRARAGAAMVSQVSTPPTMR